MLDIVERIIAEWFEHETHGVNAIAAQLPRTNFHGDDDPEPPTVAIYCPANDTSDEQTVAKLLEPLSAPALVVCALVASEAQAKGYRVAGEIPLAVFFMVEDAADGFTANRTAGLFMRATKLSLARFNSDRIAGDARELNGVKVLKVVRTTEHRATESNGRYKTPAFLEVIVAGGDAFGSPTPSTLGAFAAAG